MSNLNDGLTEKKGFTPEKSAPAPSQKAQRPQKEQSAAGSKGGKSFSFK